VKKLGLYLSIIFVTAILVSSGESTTNGKVDVTTKATDSELLGGKVDVTT